MYPPVVAIGVGPGDPELLTLKGVRLLREADVVIAPVGDRSSGSIARKIAAPYLDETRQMIIEQVYPMKKNQEGLGEFWAESAREVVELLKQGKKVAFVTLGDPLLYSTFLYLKIELQKIDPQIPVQFVSGISSVHAAAALAGLPLGLSDERLAILPATYEEEKLRATLSDFDTVVLMKVHKVFPQVLSLLEELGLKDQSVYVKRIGLPEEDVFTQLDWVRPEDLDYLSMIIVRKRGSHGV